MKSEWRGGGERRAGRVVEGGREKGVSEDAAMSKQASKQASEQASRRQQAKRKAGRGLRFESHLEGTHPVAPVTRVVAVGVTLEVVHVVGGGEGRRARSCRCVLAGN